MGNELDAKISHTFELLSLWASELASTLWKVYHAHMAELVQARSEFCKQILEVVVESQTSFVGSTVPLPENTLIQEAVGCRFAKAANDMKRSFLTEITKVMEQQRSLAMEATAAQMLVSKTRRRPNLSTESKAVLHAWFAVHVQKPYPNQREKGLLAEEAGVSMEQVVNWFTNARARLWKPLLLKIENEASESLNQNDCAAPRVVVDTTVTATTGLDRQVTRCDTVPAGIHRSEPDGKAVDICITPGVDQEQNLDADKISPTFHNPTPTIEETLRSMLFPDQPGSPPNTTAEDLSINTTLDNILSSEHPGSPPLWGDDNDDSFELHDCAFLWDKL